MEFKEKLMHIQTKMKAPKNLYNSFGRYNYRNAESILEAVKPFLAEYKTILIIEDEINNVGVRFYDKATATLCDCESDNKISVTAYAREEETKKGMDGSQITGAASSYARKYALNGLFLLDDTKDADTDEYKNERTKKSNIQAKKTQLKKVKYATAEQVKIIRTKFNQAEHFKWLEANYGTEKVEELTEEQAKVLVESIKKALSKGDKND